MASRVSFKRIQIDKANSSTVAAVAASAFVVVFGLMTSRTLLEQRTYQNKVITKKTAAREQLKANIASLETLKSSYVAFVSQPENVIGGNSSNSQEESGGDNAKIVLDALPSVYDFPALLSSIEKLLSTQNVPVRGISGTDIGDQVEAGGGEPVIADVPPPEGAAVPVEGEAAAANGTAVEMPFSIEAETSYQGARDMISLFERSIRPMRVNNLTLTGNDSALNITIDLVTYYQPGIEFRVGKETVE